MKNCSLEITDYIFETVVAKMRDAIAEGGGNEVFFLGSTDQGLVVDDATILARGDGESVPAVARRATMSDVVIHNHPDGSLIPSKADLAIAAELGNRGVGFYIIDNAVEKIYPVVMPAREEGPEPLVVERLAAYLKPGGEVAAQLNDFEYREEQGKMLEVVVRAFNEGRIAMIEAGTGTGKSLAYLIPAIAWSLKNRERVVVSTNTINLQEQLIAKDLPLLRTVNGLQCNAVLVKGRGKYLCLRKLTAVSDEEGLVIEGEMTEIMRWARTTADGSLTDLGFVPRRECWERVCAEGDQCARVHCRFYGNCFFYRARRAASSAHVLVVNHHLLMADLAVRKRAEGYEGTAVLPPFGRVVVDEAQHLEDVATEYLGFRVSRFGFLKVLRRLQSSREEARGLLPYILVKIRSGGRAAGEGAGAEVIDLVTDTLLPDRLAIEGRIDAAMGRIAAELRGCVPGCGENAVTLRITPDVVAGQFWQSVLCPVLQELIRAVEPFAGRLYELLRLLAALPDTQRAALESPCIEIAAMQRRIGEHLQCLSLFMEETEGYCRWLELAPGKRVERLSFCAAPLAVAEGLRESLYDRYRTVVMTSATLTVGGRFDYFTARLGLQGYDSERTECVLLPSPFDYAVQSVVAAPRGIPEPDREGYEEMLESAVREAVRIAGGRSFVLFTSYRLLTKLYERLAGGIGEMGLTPLKQGSDHRTAILNRFRRAGNAVLFATDSFWEGVDVKGEALECVILTRLPFRVPDEPIQQARVEAIELAGGDPFMEYSVPQAVIKFRQGFGRLIRHRDDIGAVLILDARVHTRRYGKLFLESLPAAPIHTGRLEECLAAMEGFFAKARRRTPPRAGGAAPRKKSAPRGHRAHRARRGK
ncbi:MAG: DEAD/DEAH box helicase [Candidatus Aureabacteria bacterium]|nr:DEAD/DEAH box helicase [Candidatus Auribacterota bacterium]